MAFALTGCGSSGSGSGSSSSSSIVDKSLKDSDLSIDDFAWEVKQTVIKGERCYAMKLENKSDYALMGVEIEYKTQNVILWNGIEDSYWDNLPTKAQFKVMEPDMLSLGVIGKDSTVYVAYYDFVKEAKFTEDSYGNDSFYTGEDKDGNDISVYYYEESMKMDVQVSLADKEDEEE